MKERERFKEHQPVYLKSMLSSQWHRGTVQRDDGGLVWVFCHDCGETYPAHPASVRTREEAKP